MSNPGEESVLKRNELHLSTEYQKPESEVAEILAGIWQRVLNLDLVGLNDDFFEIGGDSLGASVLAGELESRFACRFSPSHMIEASTVAAQLEYIERQRHKESALPSNLIACNEAGTKPPLFIIHGGVGFTIYDKRFLEGFDKEQPIIFIEAPGLDGSEPPLDRIESFAERYLHAIRQIAPAGNWLLAANCGGSLIAIEMCKQAEAAGEKVSCLMLLDPKPDLFKMPRQKSLRRLRKEWHLLGWSDRLRCEWKQLLHLIFSKNQSREAEEFDVIQDFRRQRQAKMEKRIQTLASGQERALIAEKSTYNADTIRQVSFKFNQAVEEYAAPKWVGPVFVLQAEKSSRDPRFLKTHFSGAKRRVTIYTHKTLFTDGLPDIIRFLNEAIAPDAQERFL